MVFGAILAGGKGTRMGIDKPKQFLMLGSRPIIIHTIEKFILSPDIDEIYVGVHPDWIDYTEDLIKKYIDSDKNIILVPGGTDRNSTIFNIIDEIEKRNGDDEDNIIVTHDSVRPFVTLRCNSLFFPVHQIFADNMSPVHPSPARRIRETLVKKMIHTFVIYKSIRVIHPVVFRFYIYFLHILLTFLFFYEWINYFHRFFCFCTFCMNSQIYRF